MSDLFALLRDEILSGRIPTGQRITEQKICETYQVSRTPVREAFFRLELLGLIELIPNRGAFVLGMSQQEIRDLYEMRKVCEILAVKWSIQRMTEEELIQLTEACELMEFYTQKQDYEKMLSGNRQFHELISRASHNRMLERTLSSFHAYVKQHKIQSQQERDPDADLAVILEEHKQILKAFQQRDQKAAVAAMSYHLDQSKKRAGL